MTEGSHPRPLLRGVVAVAFAVVVTALGGMPIWVLSAFAPRIQEELGFDSAGLGLAIGCFFAFSALVSLPTGRFVDRLGWRKGVAFTGAVAAASLLGVALLGNGWILLVLLLCIGSVSNSSSQPAGNLAIAASIPVRRQGLAFGIKQAALPIATFVVGLSVPLFAMGRDWRGAFATAGIIGIVLLVAALVERWFRAPSEPRRRGRWKKGMDAEAHVVPVPRVKVPRALVLLAIGAGFGTAATISLGGFLVTFAVDRGFSIEQGGQLLALGSLVGIVSRIFSGYRADKRGRRHLVAVAVMMVGGSAGLFLFALFDSVPMLIAGTVLAFGLGWGWNGVLHLAVARYSTIPLGAATSVVQTAMSLGAAIGPITFGLLAAIAFPAAWAAAGAVLACGAVFILLGRRALSR